MLSKQGSINIFSFKLYEEFEKPQKVTFRANVWVNFFEEEYFETNSFDISLCSWGANMRKKIAGASSVDFHT